MLARGASRRTEVKLERVLDQVAGVEEIEVPEADVRQEAQRRRSALEYICSAEVDRQGVEYESVSVPTGHSHQLLVPGREGRRGQRVQRRQMR